jgi:hypothetical protein
MRENEHPAGHSAHAPKGALLDDTYDLEQSVRNLADGEPEFRLGEYNNPLENPFHKGKH